MAKVVLLNSRVLVAGVDLTGFSNKAELKQKAVELDATTFGSGGDTEVLGGLRSGTVDMSGLFDAGDSSLPDDALNPQLGLVTVVTLAPEGATVGAVAYLAAMMEASYDLTGGVGEIAAWEMSGVTSGLVGRGQVAHPPGTARTTSGTGTALNLGATAAGKRLVMAVQVQSATGSLAITPRLETDDLVGFASPTTVATGTSVTVGSSPSAQVLAATGPITDAFQRVAWTITGSGSALFVAAIAVV